MIALAQSVAGRVVPSTTSSGAARGHTSAPMPRHVKGTLFVDYVRMLRSRKQVDWSRFLTEADRVYLDSRVEPEAWYPMETFERFGLAILDEVAGGDLFVVRTWGRLQVEHLVSTRADLLVAGDPRESLMRVHVMRRSFFDFGALEIPELSDANARVFVQYGMGNRAEQAAAHQTLGFFGRLVELAGAASVRTGFEQRAWEGDGKTVLALEWEAARR
jgi:hypothetical protein